MTNVPQLFVVAAALAAALGLITIWAPRRLTVKGTALAIATVFLPVSYASLIELLGQPKPIDLEWWRGNATEAEVVAARPIEDQGIYLWLQLPDVAEPRAFVLPWDRAGAEQLQRAMREAERNGSGVQMRQPFEPSLDDGEPKFYARPQPALPPKDVAQPPPEFYQPPGRDA
jgi:hypothetical protein